MAPADAESQADSDAQPLPAEAEDAPDALLLEAQSNGALDEPEELFEQGYEGVVGMTIDSNLFPDERLQAYVADAYDADGDGVLSDEERLAVAEFDISDVGKVFSLKGLENFTAIKALNLKGLWLTSVDLSPFAALETLNCEDSRLTAIDLQNNPKLRVLHVSGSDLAVLDVSRNAQLTELKCANCRLTNLTIGQGSALETLVCNNNSLTGLSLDQVALSLLNCAGNSLATVDISNCP